MFSLLYLHTVLPLCEFLVITDRSNSLLKFCSLDIIFCISAHWRGKVDLVSDEVSIHLHIISWLLNNCYLSWEFCCRFDNVQEQHLCCGISDAAVLTGVAEFIAETCRSCLHWAHQRREVCVVCCFGTWVLGNGCLCLSCFFPTLLS